MLLQLNEIAMYSNQMSLEVLYTRLISPSLPY